MEKIVRIGQVNIDRALPCDLYCKIIIKDGKLSITGVEGPFNRDCRGACGQIIMHEWDIVSYADGWDADKVSKFREIWDRWHLNDMVPGTPKQMEVLRRRKEERGNGSHYDWALKVLTEENLQPDGEYRYGSKWRSESLPQDVLEYLGGLPNTDKTPAWV